MRSTSFRDRLRIVICCRIPNSTEFHIRRAILVMDARSSNIATSLCLLWVEFGTSRDLSRSGDCTGRLIAERGIELVYGGGHVGLMGALADAALAANGRVIGVMPQSLIDREVGHGGLSEMRIVGSMHERKALMVELADGFIALPGGYGTLDEFCEVLTWAQLGIHTKP